jgi:hypothetical protein
MLGGFAQGLVFTRVFHFSSNNYHSTANQPTNHLTNLLINALFLSFSWDLDGYIHGKEIFSSDRRLPLRFTVILPSSRLLLSVDWLNTDVSGQPICSRLQRSSVPWRWEPIGCPETSVINQPTLFNNPEDGRIQTVTYERRTFLKSL